MGEISAIAWTNIGWNTTQRTLADSCLPMNNTSEARPTCLWHRESGADHGSSVVDECRFLSRDLYTDGGMSGLTLVDTMETGACSD
jgi:hypothetical protein